MATNYLGDRRLGDKTFGRHHIYLVCPFIPLAIGDETLEKSRCRLVESLQLTCIGNALWSKHTLVHKVIKANNKEVLFNITVVLCIPRTNEAKLSRVITSFHPFPATVCYSVFKQTLKQCYAVQVLIIRPTQVLCDDFSKGQWSKPYSKPIYT